MDLDSYCPTPGIHTIRNAVNGKEALIVNNSSSLGGFKEYHAVDTYKMFLNKTYNVS